MFTLSKGTKAVSSMTTIAGSNAFARSRELSTRVSAFTKKHGAVAVERIDGEDVDYRTIAESLEGMSLFTTAKLVILRSPSAQKMFVENFTKLRQRIPETTEVIIIEPKLDKRTAYYKELKSKTAYIECKQLDEQQLVPWLVTEAKASIGTINSSDARLLVERIGANQQALHGELQKLLTFDRHVTKQSIELLTDISPQSTIFQLVDAAFTGKTKRALDLYWEQRQQGAEPLAIIGMLAWQLHIVGLIIVSNNTSADSIANKARLSPFVVRKSQVVAGRLNKTSLKKLVQDLLALDISLKSQPINADDALSQYILKLSNATS